jgi:hypothetical protein
MVLIYGFQKDGKKKKDTLGFESSELGFAVVSTIGTRSRVSSTGGYGYSKVARLVAEFSYRVEWRGYFLYIGREY